MDIGNRLVDSEWKGIDGKGPHDLALFVGLPYYMELTILSGLKHYAPHTQNGDVGQRLSLACKLVFSKHLRERLA